jgi:predicted acyltransferase
MATPETVEKELHVEAAAAAVLPAVPPVTERLGSLDTFRGFIMFWIIGGDALLHALSSAGHSSVLNFLAYEASHTPWQGLRFYDCIWPSFMLMAGLSIPFSYAKRSLTESDHEFRMHALKRALILFLLGAIRESVYLKTPCLVELSSALQPIGIAYFVGAMLVRKSPRFLAIVAGSILAGYALLLALVPAPGIPAGTYELNHNLVNAVDLYFFKAHWDIWPYAPEGWGTVLSTIPTISTTLFGVIIGKLLMTSRSKQAKARMIGGLGVLLLVLGFGLSPVIPIVMKMWTTTYGLASAGCACLMFLLFFWLVDMRGYRKWTLLFVVIGVNPIFIYMATSILPLHELIGIFSQPIAAHLGAAGDAFNALFVLVVEWLILFWMYKRKIFLKA